MSMRKGQDLPEDSGVLYVVATPIGNLQDLSPRAAEALRACDTVLCEDTRHTSKLLSVLGISKPLERLDQHATSAKVKKVAELIRDGQVMALVSDAGTPGVSDPGAELVRECQQTGVRIIPIPGPSAVPAILSASGVMHPGFAFLGFIPRSASEFSAQIDRLKRFPDVRGWIWFESPHRLLDSLEVLERLLPGSRLTAGKELTKIHEKIYGGDLKTVIEAVRDEVAREGERGEWVILVEIGESDRVFAERNDEEIRLLLQAMMNTGVSASRASREVSQTFGIAKNRVYEIALTVNSAKKEGQE